MNIIKACNTAVLVLHTVSLRVMFGKSAIVNTGNRASETSEVGGGTPTVYMLATAGGLICHVIEM